MSDSIKILQDTLTYGSISATGTLTISGESTFKGSVSTGKLTVSGDSVLIGSISSTGTLNVSGDSTLKGSVSTGTLTISGDSTTTGNISVSGYGVFTGSVNTGNLNVSGNSVVTGTGKFSGNTLTLGDQTAQVLITNIPTTSALPVAQRMVLQGVDGYASGEGTDLYIWAGNGGYRSQADDMDPEGSSRLGSGGDIKIDAGRGEDGGTIKIRGGYSQGAEALSTVSGGYVSVEAGNSQWGYGGDITATAGYGPQGGGSISLTTRNISQTNVWTFSQNGTLSTAGSISLASGADIIRDGVSVLGDYLPLSGGNMTGAIKFGEYSYSPRITQGLYDASRGGLSGISLVCSVDYDFNWQAGWITALEQDRLTPRPLYVDSGAGTTIRAWTSAGSGTEVSHTGITFPNASVQTSAINKFVSAFGNTSDTSYVLNHNLSTEDVTVTVIEVATKSVVYPSVTNTSSTEITVEFSEVPTSSNSYKAIVIG
jgi:cytoskeletal protein CcmA (bactofilin family)